MKQASAWTIVFLLLSAVSTVEATEDARGFWSCGSLGTSWARMNTFEKCIAAVVVPPGYVIGICSKSVAWLFAGQRKF